MNLNSGDIAQIVNGRLSGPADLPAIDIITDSRHVIQPGGIIFFAIRGKNHDGHIFIDHLYRKGVRIFVCEKEPDALTDYPLASFISVHDTVEALQLLAAHRRKGFSSTVIGITGSAGKTVVKEWLAEIIGHVAPVVRSPRSYNSQVGVPLSVWNLDAKYRYGIFEAGISQPGEMDKLRNIIDPDIGVITNIGDAHRENFPDDTMKAREKLKLFTGSKTIVYCRDHGIIHNQIIENGSFRAKNIVDWSFTDREARIYVTRQALPGGHTGILMLFDGQAGHFEIPFSDRASVENAVTAAAVCLAIGLGTDVISGALRGLTAVAMRMEMKSGINNCQLIEDYYNSDPGSLGMALEYLRAQAVRNSTLILSDFVQSGRDERELYGEVASLIRKTGIGKFIGIGKALSGSSDLFGPDARFFFSTDEFIHNFSSAGFRDETILLKGARIYEFEKIGNLLEQQIHQTVLEINLDAVSHNLSEFRSRLEPGTMMMAMVKAFAYGAGPAEIASLLEYHRVSYLAVAYAGEGVELRNAGVALPVMVMNPDPSAVDLMIRYNLEPELFSFASFNNFTEAALRHGLLNYPVHIKVDTGMHRLGFMPDEAGILAGMIRSAHCIKVVSVFSHLAASENPALDHFSRMQAETFLKFASRIREAAGYPVIRHLLNSSGIARMPEYQFEMVRPGIGIYGAGRIEGMSLKAAGRFRTRISQVKTVRAGEPVGYGCADMSGTDRIIAILPVGYADGLNRKLGNRNGNLFIKSSRVPLIGNICMDMCMADITGLDANEGDEAEIFGENITIDELAVKCGTIPYEILTSIPVRVKRVFYRD